MIESYPKIANRARKKYHSCDGIGPDERASFRSHVWELYDCVGCWSIGQVESKENEGGDNQPGQEIRVNCLSLGGCHGCDVR